MSFAPGLYYTGTPYGEFFFKQGRSTDFSVKGCVTLCFATYKHSATEELCRNEYLRKSSNPSCSRRDIHSERVILTTIEEAEKLTNSRCIKLQLYSSMSPCSKCCALIEKFIFLRPYCEVYIAFTSVYRLEEIEHTSALQALNKVENVKLLDVFTVNEWSLLLERGILSMTDLGMSQMTSWDGYWRIMLQRILSKNKNEEIHFSGDRKKVKGRHIKKRKIVSKDNVRYNTNLKLKEIHFSGDRKKMKRKCIKKRKIVSNDSVRYNTNLKLKEIHVSGDRKKMKGKHIKKRKIVSKDNVRYNTNLKLKEIIFSEDAKKMKRRRTRKKMREKLVPAPAFEAQMEISESHDLYLKSVKS